MVVLLRLSRLASPPQNENLHVKGFALKSSQSFESLRVVTPIRRTVQLLRGAAASWQAHESPRLGAAVAFYTLIALSPMVSLVLSLLSLFIGRIAAQAQMTDRIHWLIGAEESRTVSFLLQSARQPFSGGLATFVGTLALLIGASGLAGELRSGLNTIWSVERVRQSRSRALFQDKSVALAMVLVLLFLFTLSLLISASLVSTGKILAAFLPLPGLVLRLGSLVFSIGISSLVFAFMFRWVPAMRPSWGDVLVGAGFTGALFTIGKILMDRFLITSSSATTYGVASPFILVTLWVYYSTQVFLFGAEFTYVYAKYRNSKRTRDSEPLLLDDDLHDRNSRGRTGTVQE